MTASVRRLVCASCGLEQDDRPGVCGNCGYPLSHAQSVYASPSAVPGRSPPVEDDLAPNAADAVDETPTHPSAATGSFCACKMPRRDGAAACIFCCLPYGPPSPSDGLAIAPVPPLADPPRAPPTVAAAGTDRTPTAAVLCFTGGQRLQVGAGLVLGRSINGLPEALDATLSRVPGVSRLHAWLGRDSSGQLIVVDLGSRNGTRLNGVLLRRGVATRVAWGDSESVRLTLGRHVELQLEKGV